MHPQRGETLVGLLVGLALGLLVAAAGQRMLAQQLRHERQTKTLLQAQKRLTCAQHGGFMRHCTGLRNSHGLQWASSIAQCLKADASNCHPESSQTRGGVTYQLQLSNASSGEGLSDWHIAITWPARHADIGSTVAGQLHL